MKPLRTDSPEFQLDPTVTDLAVNPVVAASLIARLIEHSKDGAKTAQRLTDQEEALVISVRSGDANDNDRIHLELDPARQYDSSQVYSSFLRGAQRALFDKPDNHRNRRSLEEAVDSLITVPRPLEPLLYKTDS